MYRSTSTVSLFRNCDPQGSNEIDFGRSRLGPDIDLLADIAQVSRSIAHQATSLSNFRSANRKVSLICATRAIGVRRRGRQRRGVMYDSLNEATTRRHQWGMSRSQMI
jgi:hypothetical protein